jgi:preprotein translocase subunit SecG
MQVEHIIAILVVLAVAGFIFLKKKEDKNDAGSGAPGSGGGVFKDEGKMHEK